MKEKSAALVAQIAAIKAKQKAALEAALNAKKAFEAAAKAKKAAEEAAAKKAKEEQEKKEAEEAAAKLKAVKSRFSFSVKKDNENAEENKELCDVKESD